MNYQGPAYQRAMQRLQRTSPNGRAIIGSLVNDLNFKFADEAIRGELASKAQTQDVEHANKRLGLGHSRLKLRERGHNLNAGARRDRFDFMKGQGALSTFVGGTGVAASAYLGKKKVDVDNQLFKHILGRLR